MVEYTAEGSWKCLMETLRDRLVNGELVIPSGMGTNLYTRIDPTKLPFEIAFKMLEAGMTKPITDISVNKEKGETWPDAHQRRVAKRDGWYKGEWNQKGGQADEVTAQMKVEFEEFLKDNGFKKSVDANKELFKGNIQQMLDACEKAGMALDRKEILEEMHQRASKKIGDRGKAKAEVIVPKGFKLTLKK